MKTVLITGGTVFVSRYLAEYYVAKGCDVSVLNRNTRKQSPGVRLIQADRHDLGSALRPLHFDLVIDTAYTGRDVDLLLDALGGYGQYILISSSAVYPDCAPQPFTEETPLGPNQVWGRYGTDKIEAERALLARDPDAYILRPPYLYGPMNNVYREAFVFDCALQNRPFYLPGDGAMNLQFFQVDDLGRFIDVLLARRPDRRIFNVGSREAVSVRQWVELCYQAAGKQAELVPVYGDIEQRNYFCFYNYEYYLDISQQYALMPDVKPLSAGLREAFAWYKNHSDEVGKKPYWDYIDHSLI